MRSLSYLKFLILFSFITSCLGLNSDEVDQDSIESFYSLVYEAEDDQSIASAIFISDNTFIQLKNSAKVLFNDKEMIEVSPLGAYSYNIFTDELISSGEFKYTNEDNTTYTNSIILTEFIGVPSDIEVSFSEIDLKWSGPPIAENQVVTFFIRNHVASFEKSVETVGANSIRLNRGELPLVFGGDSEVYFARTERFPLEQGNAEGGEIASEYRSQIKTVIVQ